MNRYVLEGVLADVRRGKTVLVLGETTSAVAGYAWEIEHLLEPGERARHAHNHGLELDGPGPGHASFVSARSNLRGLRADVAVTPEWLLSQHLLDDLHRVVGDLGEIVRV